ncbi:hypothetical protein [Microbacterium foliorum]|uniref:hypothetical protein n=1 Tax=Microbacterium foliorum TaxID=104336 RepID=UPI0028D7BD80|nr:hypothetical protein [Microbacterium foliorum]
MVDPHEPDPRADPVIPPPPAIPGTSETAPHVVPLAPPLSGPASPAPGAPPAASPDGYGPPPPPQLPPYASTGQPGSAGQPGTASQFGAVSQPGIYPTAAYPGIGAPAPARTSGRAIGIVFGSIGAVLIVGIIAVAVLLGSLTATRTDPSTAPLPTSISEPPSGPDAGAGAEIADILDAKMDEYKRLRDSGALWQSIPDNDFNRTAVAAFLFFLTDMKVATLWGVDAAQAQEYEERMTMLEERLLAQQPLGDDIKITLEDQIFTYDGETGEGGFTPK